MPSLFLVACLHTRYKSVVTSLVAANIDILAPSSSRDFSLTPDNCGFNDNLDHHASGFSAHRESFRI
ncbi:hypothetical protein PILCRDRAFT_649741 [Piloderma croceum F 1598]|uniref:Uncharacterized protein n=1 Tax=Piloderma croceum (strain F 1598) TaxID=765440 RepID=A0A0C3EV81_PILCF|nr:hypothetical protein PILCRDRAFT_649741 [Piloderma croceum F 1598]